MSIISIKTSINEVVKLSEQVFKFEEDDAANFDDDVTRERFWLTNKEDETVFCDYVDQYTKEQLRHLKKAINKGYAILVKAPKFRIDLYDGWTVVNDDPIEWHEAFEINKANSYKYRMVMLENW